jgi:hypothetical protein
MKAVSVHVDAAAKRDEPAASSDDEQLLVVALRRAGVVLLGVTVGDPVQRPHRFAVQPGVVGVDQMRRIPQQDADLHATLASTVEQIEQAGSRSGEVDPRVAPPGQQINEVLIGVGGFDCALNGGECGGAVD